MQIEITDRIWDDATEVVLGDVDTYLDWLAGQCLRQTNVPLTYVPMDEVTLAQFIDGASVPELVALSLYPRVEAAGLACKELRTRYLDRPETQERIHRIASDIAANEA